MLAVSVWFWIGFIAFVLAMLALDLGVFHRTPHEVRPKEAGIWVGVWVALALAFAAGLHFWAGKEVALTFLTGENGRRIATPRLLVLILVEFTDLIFAIDSIPAIFGVTTDPFLVFTSNIFAVMGLRSLYFLLAAVVDRFHLLKYGLALILTFVGFKMLTERFIEIDIVLSLSIILGVLALSITASLMWPRSEAR